MEQFIYDIEDNRNGFIERIKTYEKLAELGKDYGIDDEGFHVLQANNLVIKYRVEHVTSTVVNIKEDKTVVKEVETSSR